MSCSSGCSTTAGSRGGRERPWATRATPLLWSIASSWELAIKVSLGKARVPGHLRTYLPLKLQEQGITTLPVEHVHAFEAAELPQHHRDSFDRMLIAQARVERVPVVTADEQFGAYDVQIVWDWYLAAVVLID